MDHESSLPPPSPELVALRIFAEAHWRSLRPKERLRFQKRLSEVLSEIETQPILFRPPDQHAALKVARVGATAWVNRVMRGLVTRG